MSSTVLAVTPRWIAILKRFGPIFLLLVFLIYLIPRDRVQSVWGERTSSKLKDQFGKGLDEPIGNADWGLMGKQVKQLSDWGTYYTTNVFIDPKPVNDALKQRFPFMKRAKIYKPWAPEPEADRDSLAKTGMILCVGSKDYHLAAHLIVTLRNVLKSTIPIEVAFAGDSDLKPQHRDFLQNLGDDITMIDLLQVFPEATVDLENSGWATKPFAVLASKHKEVILVDADAIFLTKPDELFRTHTELNRTGTLLFHDRAVMGGGDEGLLFLKAQIDAAGIRPSQYLTHQSLFYIRETWYEADSGLVAVNKSRADVFMSIVFTAWLNTKPVREEVSYKLFYGDKETFWIAAELCSLEYFFQPWYAGAIGAVAEDQRSNGEDQETELCSTHMLHMDQSGTVPFWINGGIYQHKKQPERGFAHMTHWWRGNTDAKTKPEIWWNPGNIACLKQKHVIPISPTLSEDLEKMYAEAGRIDEARKDIPS